MQLVRHDHLVSWDIKSAYHHLPLHRDVRQYMVFRVGDRFYEPQTLPFAVPLARFHLRALYDALRGVAPRRDARLDAQSLRDLRWWQALGSDDSVGRALGNGPSAGEVTTDASPYGWGATFQRLVPARGYFQPDVQDWHINAKELAAVRQAVLSFTPLFRRGSRLAVRTDSRVTMGVLNTMCSRSPA
eukprot:contig_2688_g535